MKRSISLAALIISILLVLTSGFLPVTVESQTDLAQVELGLPWPFIVQNQGQITPPLFPWQTSVRIPLENPTQILWSKLLLDVVTVFGVTSLVLVIFFSGSSKH